MRRRMHLAIGLLVVGACIGSAQSQAPSWRPVLRGYGIRDERLLRAMDKVSRADFLPESLRKQQYEDRPLPIGYGQTTSQPSLIALMVEALRLKPGCVVLEVGTGSGYQTALLAELCDRVASVEIIPPLADRARTRLEKLGYRNVEVRAGDGYLGYPELAPFDGIVVGAAAPKLPNPLIRQLKVGGRMVIPVGSDHISRLMVITKQSDGGYESQESLPVSFVPLTGKNADQDRR